MLFELINKFAGDIKEKKLNNPYHMLHGLNLVLRCVAGPGGGDFLQWTMDYTGRLEVYKRVGIPRDEV